MPVLAVAGQSLGIQMIGLAVAAQGAQEGVDPARIAAMNGQAKCGCGGQKGRLIASSGFAHQERLLVIGAQRFGKRLLRVLDGLGGVGRGVEQDDRILADVATDHIADGTLAHRALSSVLLVIVCGREPRELIKRLTGADGRSP